MNAPSKPSFQLLLADRAQLVEAELAQMLADGETRSRMNRPGSLRDAMRYSVLNGGKRLRPFLLMECARLFGVEPDHSLFAAMAVECIHSYSLVHDDLPAMDDDDLRRGKPTVHKAYDEATAILVGDALQALAFELLADNPHGMAPEVIVALVKILAGASGFGGMVGGQALDMEAENRSMSKGEVSQLQSMKTGALIRASCLMGARLGTASESDLLLIGRYGDLIGEAFQLADDILDQTSTISQLGKAVEKDAERGKATLVAHLGIKGARARADQLRIEAKSVLEPFGPKASLLKDAADFIVVRKH